MQSVSVLVGFDGYDSEVLSSDHLGTNILFHSDRTHDGSDFDEVITGSGIRFIRYPGGTISEEYFDISNPDADVQFNILDTLSGANNVRERVVVPLSDFLAYSADIGANASIVLPTYRFFDPITGEVRPEAEAEIREFINDLLLGTYGSVDGLVLELGNEWYQHRFEWTTEQFGYLQATIASWIDDEARSLGMRDDITLLAQTGRSESENELLSSFFDSPGLATIDGVVTHLYGTNSSGDPMGIGSGINNRLDEINDIWSQVLGTDFELAVTEWNVGENGEDDTQINGLMRLAPLMRIYGEMLSNGVDLAMIWSAQTNGPAGLSSREGYGSDLSPTGYFYSMLAHSIDGMQLVDTGSDFRLRGASGSAVGYTYTFEEDGNLVSYFVSGIDEAISLEVDLSEYYVPGAYVYATILGAASGENGTEYWAEASIQHITNIDLTTTTADEWQFLLQLDPYELVELHVVAGGGVTISGDSQNEISDTFDGSQYADHLSGDLGNDSISGGRGNDYLDGGDGNDFLSGQNDHDTLVGGSGNDTLVGGHGKDFLDGGYGDDLLDGGNWHDTLVGGEGTDTLLGGDGNDLLSMTGGGLADGGAGEDILSFLDATEGVSVWTSDGVVETSGGLAEFTGIEEFHGSRHDDVFSIISNDTRYLGGEGDDTFTLIAGLSNFVDMGDGDDFVFLYSNSNSLILGGSGDDLFHVYDSQNRLEGGAGDDTFALFNYGSDELVFSAGDGHDIVTGFEVGVDNIEFHGLDTANLQVSEANGDILLSFGTAGSILLVDVIGIDTEADLLFL